MRDLLGIITEVVDENGSVMVLYKYDAWGKVLDKEYTPNTVGEDIALLNHFVYKGYYLDHETEWYYLKSRYYDSKIGRFINGDNYSELKTEDLVQTNLFTYCSNNPIMGIDSHGL